MKKVLLTIAGFDPSGGAGALLDTKVFEHLGFLGMSVLTALAVQNTKSVREIRRFSPRLLESQYSSLSRDVEFSGIKVGMLGSKKNIRPVSKILSGNRSVPRVIDPVFRSSSGAWLLEKESRGLFINDFKGGASVITPNLHEAGLLCGTRVETLEGMKESAERIFSLIQIPCLVKGGHLKKGPVNVLYDGNKFLTLETEKLDRDVHGTGCFFSASLLSFLARGHSLRKASELATLLTHRAMVFSLRPGLGRRVFTFSGLPDRIPN